MLLFCPAHAPHMSLHEQHVADKLCLSCSTLICYLASCHAQLWHRGVHNPSDSPRAMFALVYTDKIGYNAHVEFFGHELVFSSSCKDAFATSQLAPLNHIRFADDHSAAPPELSLE
eukprot:SAG31_NODE_1589_length_7816_cov_5.732279_3_plen_116_part_00